MKKVLLIGPLPPPLTGQSVAFSYLKILEKKEEAITILNTQKFKIQLINYLFSVFVHPFKIIFSNYTTIYFIGSRSAIGFFRQLPFLIVVILKKVKIVNHLHGADFKDFITNSGIFKPLIYWVYSRITKNIILLDEMKDQFKDFPNVKLEVIPNAIGKDFENQKIKFPKNKRLLYLSNLMASKGIIEYLNAAKQLLRIDESIHIDIAGAFIGDCKKSKKEIKSNFYKLYKPLKKSYPDRIHYYGIVHGQKKVELLKLSSIFILPTYYVTEAFPISIIEAMATGNAIITTSHNYLEYITSEKNGAIIPIKDEAEIIRNVERLFKDYSTLEKIQKTNYNLAKNYNLDSYLKRIENILLND